MKKLFGRGGGGGGKRDATGPLTNKTVQVGRHTLLVAQLLGSGGCADVYAASDTAGGGRFALKHLHLAGDAETIGLVQAEAKTMARLRGHPNVLRLHAVAFAGPR